MLYWRFSTNPQHHLVAEGTSHHLVAIRHHLVAEGTSAILAVFDQSPEITMTKDMTSVPVDGQSIVFFHQLSEYA